MKKNSIMYIGIKTYKAKLRIASRTNSTSSCLVKLKEFGPKSFLLIWNMCDNFHGIHGISTCLKPYHYNRRMLNKGKCKHLH